jgi:hypothetical protein
LEFVAAINSSANALLLETDPSNREPRAFYLLRYQEMAQRELHEALHEVRQKENSAGKEGWLAILKTRKNLALMHAEALLARDRLQKAVE